MCFFFFSSRRRHTRCSRDWSSDVCSSDLLRAFDNRDSNDHRTLLSAFPAGGLYFHIDVAVVLVKLAEFVHVLFQLDLIQTSGFIHEINWRPAARLHLFAQDFLAEVGVSLEPNLLHRSSDAFIDCENNARCAALFINRINTKLNANVSESLP